MAPSQRQPRYSRDLPEQRRRKLIEATARCLAELGVAGTSVREISQRAAVSPGLVNHHFAGKEDLIAQTYGQIGETVDGTLEVALEAAGNDPEARLTAFVEASFQPPILDGDLLAVWIGFWSLVRTDRRVFEMHREIYASYRARLEGLLEAVADKRGLTVDARLAAISLSAMLDGLWLEWCLDPEVFSPEEACATVLDWIARLWSAPAGR